jgi:uncharacterized protein Yka (UPF0111/DUF47 family)
VTPEEIIAMIGNPDNRPDLKKIQEQQVEEIYKLIKEFEDIAKTWHQGYRDLSKNSKIEVKHLHQTIQELESENENLRRAARRKPNEQD